MKKISTLMIIASICLIGTGFTQNINQKNYNIEAKKESSTAKVDPLQKQVTNLINKINALEKKIKKLELKQLQGFVKTSGNKYVFSANGAKIEIGRRGEITIKAATNIKIESAAATGIKSGAHMDIRSGGDMNIVSSILRLNNGTKPVAHQESLLHGSVTTSTGKYPVHVRIMAAPTSVLVP